MKVLHMKNTLLAFAAVAFLAGCGNGGSTAAGGSPKLIPNEKQTASPGKPSAPISIDYEVLGKPVVGTPVAINVDIGGTGDTGPVAVSYSINDASALTFQEGQVEALEMRATGETNRQQLAVIPHREGRLYVNVSAEVQTPGGSMIKSISIPIQVGSAPATATINGELKEGPDGETVISMPAER